MRIAAPALGAVPTAFGRVVLGAVGLLAWIGMKRLPATFGDKFKATLILGAVNSRIPFLIPLFGVLFGALVLGEAASTAQAAGVGLIGVALWLVLRPASVAGVSSNTN